MPDFYRSSSQLTLRACLALLLGTVSAHAETISSSATAPVRTSTVANGAADDIDLASGGTIDVATAGASALVLDSANSIVTDTGSTITSTDQNGVRGITIDATGNGALNSSGPISLLESYVAVDGDGDSYIDQPFASGADRIGILLNYRASPLSGDINNWGAITVEGNNSAGIRLLGPLAGSLTQEGAISVIGNGAYGVDVSSAVGGSVSLRGATAVTGANATGVFINAPVSGRVYVRSAISATGYRYTSAPTDATAYANLVQDGILQGGSALNITSSIGGGVMIDGVGYEDDQDDDGDGVTEAAVAADSTIVDSDEDAGASLIVYGTAPAVSIGSTLQAITLGAGSPLVEGEPGAANDALNIGYGFYNRGAISALGVYNGVSAHGVSIFGAFDGARTLIVNGLRNDGTISASAVDADAVAVSIGPYADVPLFYNNGTVTALATTDADFTATGLRYDALAGASKVVNAGTIQATLLGETGDAVAIRAYGNTITSIDNYGVISAGLTATDSDTTDKITPVVTGDAIAIDVSGATTGVTIRQFSAVARTDQDDTDDVAEAASQIAGKVLFGSGNDTFDIRGGTLTGDVSFGAGNDAFIASGASISNGAIAFGAGADTLSISSGASLYGKITDSDGVLTVDVNDGTLGLTAGTLNATSAHFGAGSTLSVNINDDATTASKLSASGAVTFDAGAHVSIAMSKLPSLSSFQSNGIWNATIVSANTISGFSGLSATLDSPYLFTSVLQQADANTIGVAVKRKTAADLGLDANESAAYDGAYQAIVKDDEASAIFAVIKDGATFTSAYRQLLPSAIGASAEMTLAGDMLAIGSAQARVGGADAIASDKISVWVQQYGGTTARDVDGWGARWDGWHWGISAGVDGPEGWGQWGVLTSLYVSEIDDGRDTSGAYANYRGSLGAYAAVNLPAGAFLRVSGVAGTGESSLDREIRIDLDNDISMDRAITGKWQTSAATLKADLNAPMRLGALTLAPSAGVIYATTWDAGYAEDGGALGLIVDSRMTQRLYADAELAARYAVKMSGATLTPYASLGWRQNLSGDPAEITARFAGGGDAFTLTDAAETDGRALASLGISITGDGGNNLSFLYNGERSSEFARDSFLARYRFAF